MTDFVWTDKVNNVDAVNAEDINTIAHEVERLEQDKQDNLESGTNIKTINGNSVLGAGNIEIQGGAENCLEGVQIDGNDLPIDTNNKVNIVTADTYDEITNPMATKMYADRKYIKPQAGIPKSDLESDVQTTLTDADTAMRIVMYGKDVTPTDDSYFNFTLKANNKEYSISPKYISGGIKTVSELNDMTDHTTYVYTVSDSGTLASGNVEVIPNDRVIWDSTNSVWEKYTTYPVLPNNLVIPYEYNGKPVTSIDNFAFQDCTSITSLVFPKSIKNATNIVGGSYIFKRCTALTSILLQSELKRVESESFTGCTALTTVDIPDGITAIEAYSFNGCTNLEKITIPDSVTDIGRQETYPTLSNCPKLVVYCNKGSYAEGYCKRNNKPYVCPELTSNKVTSLSAQSSDEQYPTAKAVYDELQNKQNSTDNTLQTVSKQIPSAINEVNSIAKGAQQGISSGNYSTMITAFNALDDDVYNVGQSIYIVTLEVPDLWISEIASTSVTYTYTTDEAFTTALQTNGYVQVGYYKLSALETGKVDLSTYYTKTEADNLLDDKLTEPSSGLAVGKYFRVASIDSDGHAVLEYVDVPTAPIQSISAGNTALTPDTNGNVNIPVLSAVNVYGLPHKQLDGTTQGIEYSGAYGYSTKIALDSDINNTNHRNRSSYARLAITTNSLDYAVKAAMTDGVGSAWTDAERLAALLRMGCTVDENGYVKWTATASE